MRGGLRSSARPTARKKRRGGASAGTHKLDPRRVLQVTGKRVPDRA